MDNAELLDRHDAVGLARLVRDGEVGPHELLDAVAGRIAARDPELTAVVAERLDAARAEIDAGLPDGPLRGVPFAVKDLGSDIAGLPTTNGSRLFADAVAAEDGELVRRYRRAGLVIVAKTNTPEFGKNASTEPLLHGPTRNPWNRAHSAGGSSGGSAAAVAAGILPAAHANDGGGSIRIPAANCGLFGLKPTRGRVPDDRGEGAFAYPVSANHAVTRTVRDSAALLDAVAGPWPGGGYAALPAPVAGSFLAALDLPPGRLRIGVSTTIPGGGALPAPLVDAVTRTGALLAELGHQVEEAEPSWDAATAVRSGSVVMAASVHDQIDQRLALLGRELRDDDLEPFTRYLYDTMGRLGIAALSNALRGVERVGRQVSRFFDEFDVWLSPTMAMTAPPLGLLNTSDPASMVQHAPAATKFTQVFNVSGHPAASVPAGLDPDGVPIGVQIAGRFGAEEVLLRLARQLEEAAPWPWQAPWPAGGRTVS